MVPQIDFLPATYHVQRQREHKTLWRRMFVFFFLALAILGTWQQRQLRGKLQARRDELQLKADGLMQSVQASSSQETQTKELETRALLLTTLGLRLPMTQVLAGITNSLPELVSLSECHTEIGLKEVGKARPVGTTPPANSNQTAKKSPFESDLSELQAASKNSAMMLTLSGVAPDDLAISRYLVALRETDLFERVTLSFTGQHTIREDVWRKFEIRLQVKGAESLLDLDSSDVRRVSIDSRSHGTNGVAR